MIATQRSGKTRWYQETFTWDNVDTMKKKVKVNIYKSAIIRSKLQSKNELIKITQDYQLSNYQYKNFLSTLSQ